MNLETASPSNHAAVYVFDGYRLESARRSLKRADGSCVPIAGKPFDVLVYLVQHAGEIVDRDAALQAVWPRRVVEENNINQAIAVLRRAIGAHHIATVAGRGYQFVTPVQEVAPPSESLGETARPAGLEQDRPDSGPSASPPEILAAAPPRAAAKPQRLRVLSMTALAAIAAAAAMFLHDTAKEAVPEALLGTIASAAALTTFPGEETTPAFSPDGTRVAFSWDGNTGNEDIYVTQVATRAVARLTTSAIGADRHPQWSPDGQFIAFMRQLDATRFDVIVIPSIGGGQERTVYQGELDWISREGFPLLAWTPDSAQVWFTTRRGSSTGELRYGLHRVWIATEAVESLELGGGTDDYDTSPVISPDGQWLAFTRYRTGERLNRVMVHALGPGFAPTGQPKVVAEAALHHSLGWSSGSDRLWFVDGGRICEWRIGGPVRVAATSGTQPSLGTVTFTHDGSGVRAAVVTRRTDTDIFALPLDPVTHAAIGPPEVRFHSTATDYHPRFSPDGTQIAFVSDRGGHRAIWIADSDSSALRQLTDLKELITGFPRWSPDGTRIAFHTSAPNEERVIYAVSTLGGVPKRVGNACCPGGWAADGEHVYVHDAGGINRLLRMSVRDGSTELLFEGESGVESADGQYLLYAKSRERGYFRRSLSVSSGSSPEEKLVGDYVPPSGGLAALADGFFYLGLAPDDRPRAFRFYDYASGEARDVWPAPAKVAIGLTVSPDGRELLYAADTTEPNADLALLEFAPLPK